jgi:dihydrodipicolinate synthase/N-acetylneuraminate lyase
VELLKSVRSGDAAKSAELQAHLQKLHDLVGLGPFPSTTKFLAWKWRGVEVGYRSPYDPLTPEEEKRVLAAADALKPEFAPFLALP